MNDHANVEPPWTPHLMRWRDYVAEELGIRRSIGIDGALHSIHDTAEYPHDYALFCDIDRLHKRVGCDVVVKAKERHAVALAVRRMGVRYEK